MANLEDAETQARRIASERVPPTAQPTPDWQLAYRDALRDLIRARSGRKKTGRSRFP